MAIAAGNTPGDTLVSIHTRRHAEVTFRLTLNYTKSWLLQPDDRPSHGDLFGMRRGANAGANGEPMKEALSERMVDADGDVVMLDDAH
jgi:hypothetical protein